MAVAGESVPEMDAHLVDLFDALVPQMQTPKAELVAEVEARLTETIGP